MTGDMVTRGEIKSMVSMVSQLDRTGFHLGMLQFFFPFSSSLCVSKHSKGRYKILTSANSKTRDLYFLHYTSFLHLSIYHDNNVFFFITRKKQNPGMLFKDKKPEKAKKTEQTGIFIRKSMFCIVAWERGRTK